MERSTVSSSGNDAVVARSGEAANDAFGIVSFAATMMMLAGAFHTMIGLVGLLNEDVLGARAQLLVVDDYSVWGWLHLGVGMLAVACGVALVAGRLWARIVTMLLAGWSALVSVAFIPAAPFFAIPLLFLDLVILWAVIVHGAEAARRV